MSETAVRERPILFSGPMVRAILDNRKTQTRRIVKPGAQARRLFMTRVYTGDRWTVLPHPGGGWWAIDVPGYRPDQRAVDTHGFPCPYGAPGDRLWVRETWGLPPSYDAAIHGPLTSKPRIGPVCYRADYGDGRPAWAGARWRPSIHMPRWASRLTLEITGVRVERVQEIGELGALAEGFPYTYDPVEDAGLARDWFGEAWDAINGKRAPWASNPWVWALTFRRVEAA